jgi:hypothetical protein
VNTGVDRVGVESQAQDVRREINVQPPIRRGIAS